METVRIGYVGCGMMAQKVHIPNIISLDDCELLALAEVRPQLGRRVQEFHGVPRMYASHEELSADADVDAVAVSAQYAAQGEIAADLLRAGKDVFMEKPMAVTVEQAERILDAERQGGGRLMVAYMKRYDRGNELVKRLVDEFRESGELGELRYVRNHGFCGDWIAGLDTPMIGTDEPYPPGPEIWPDWCPEDRRRGYVGYLQQYTHNVNLLRWLLDAGGEVEVVAVDLDAEGGMRGVTILNMAGVRCVIESGGLPYHGWEEHTQLYFDKGWIRTEAPPLLLRNVPATVEVYRGDRDEKTESRLFPAGGWTWSYKEEMRHFVHCVREGAPFRSPGSDALEDVRTLEAIYRKFVEQQS